MVEHHQECSVSEELAEAAHHYHDYAHPTLESIEEAWERLEAALEKFGRLKGEESS